MYQYRFWKCALLFIWKLFLISYLLWNENLKDSSAKDGRDDSLGNSVLCQAGLPELESPTSQEGQRRDPQSCPLTSMGALWHEQAHRQTDSHSIYIKHFNFSKISGKIKGLTFQRLCFPTVRIYLTLENLGLLVCFPVFIINTPWFYFCHRCRICFQTEITLFLSLTASFSSTVWLSIPLIPRSGRS